MFQVKNRLWPDLKLAAEDDNANLILILASSISAKTWWYHVAENTLLKSKHALPSSNLFLVQLPVLEVLKNVLPIYCHRFCLEFEYTEYRFEYRN